MKIIYTGPYPQVEIGLDNGGRIPATRNGPAVEVPEAIGAELIERGDFKQDEAQAPKK